MEVRGRRSREMSPERVKNSPQPKVVLIRPTFKRVQVVYYLSRNGQLEHPHFMEVTHLANHQLRLKDVIDQLTVLRGKCMPTMYSWSCKRSYKNGYVWNDLAENDIIYPLEGAEYILKGSEVVDGSTDKEPRVKVSNSIQVEQLQLGNTQRLLNEQQMKIFDSKPRLEQQLEINQYDRDIEGHEHKDKEIEYEKKIRYTDSNSMPHPHPHPHPHPGCCSRGVSTDEVEVEVEPKQTEIAINGFSPLSTTSSTVSDKGSNGISKRFEDGDPVGTQVLMSRSSMLFQLIACGGSLSFRKNVPAEKHVAAAASASTVGRKSNCNELHKGVLCKTAGVGVRVGAKVGVKVLMEDEDDEIRCMLENPRFGNMQVCEEKEYFSGSIVETMSSEERAQVEPCLKKSNSYNEKRCPKSAFVEAAEEETLREKGSKSKSMSKMKPSVQFKK